MAKYKQAQKRRINWAVIIAAFLAVALIIETVGICLGWFVQKPDAEAGGQWNGLIAKPEESGSAMKMSVTRTSLNEGETSEQADGYTLTVTFNEGATFQDVTWAFAWDGESEADVNEYFELTPNGLTATARAKQAFATPVRVTATSDFNTNVSASCKFDYLAELQNVTLNIDGPIVFEGETPYTLDYTYGVGTLRGEYRVDRFESSYDLRSVLDSAYFKAAVALDSNIGEVMYGYPEFTDTVIKMSYTDYFGYFETDYAKLPTSELSEEILSNLKAAVASVSGELLFRVVGTYAYGEYSKEARSALTTVSSIDVSALATPVTDININTDHIVIFPVS